MGPESVGVQDPLSEGREVLSRHDWRPAYDQLSAADFLAHTHGNRGEGSAANGWIAKAARVLECEPEGAGHVALEKTRAVFAQYGGRPEDSVRHAEEALRIAETLTTRRRSSSRG